MEERYHGRVFRTCGESNKEKIQLGSATSPVVEVNSVSKKFGDRMAVDRLSLKVPAGICFGL